MKNRWVTWVIAIIVTALLSVAVISSDRLPGDLSVARFLQSVAPGDNSWAEEITTSAKIPWNFLLLAITVLFSWLIAGWRDGSSSWPAFYCSLSAGARASSLGRIGRAMFWLLT